MTVRSEIFEKNYKEYCSRLAEVDFNFIADRLGLECLDERLQLPFFCKHYQVSGNGITDTENIRPDYMTCVILARYILNCPDKVYLDTEDWVSFKDFKKESAFLNGNFFTSDTEKAIAKAFSGRLPQLKNASTILDGISYQDRFSYDIAMRFQALPHIALLMLYNDCDEDFPANCSVLFSKQAEYYLDPESLAMTGATLARLLRTVS